MQALASTHSHNLVQALDLYTNIDDIKRVIVNTHAISLEVLSLSLSHTHTLSLLIIVVTN